MLDAKKQNHQNNQEVDKEWLILLTFAKQKGFTVQQVKQFLREKKLSD
ncbi:hypothetical protein [Gracilibacillus salitolerans]|nr:hypothetical protein [Gracilibacillus salitolerans]